MWSLDLRSFCGWRNRSDIAACGGEWGGQMGPVTAPRGRWMGLYSFAQGLGGAKAAVAVGGGGSGKS